MRFAVVFVVTMAAAMGAGALEVTDTEGKDLPGVLTISDGDKVVFQYRYVGVPFKPYADVVSTPKGINVVRDAPHDHLHHHALMFAIKVDGVNFWEEHDAPGIQAHRALQRTLGQTGDSVSFGERVDWLHNATREVLLQEQRSITVDATKDVTLVTWRGQFTLPEGKEQAELTGSHYHGLGMRFLESMDKDGEFRNSADAEGQVFRGTEKLVDGAGWCAYTAKADGEIVTIAMFDDPDNPRPVTWFTMTDHFAYLSATLRYHEQPLTVKAGENVNLRYGVAVWDGKASDKKIAQAYQAWLEKE
jgi:hypothetical protein